MKNYRFYVNKFRFIGWWLYRLIFLKSHLEIELCGNCNLNCKGCSHYSPLANNNHLSLQELKDIQPILSKLSSSFRTVRLLGGEPLLNGEINEIIHFIRLTFPNTPISLLTNGILLLNKKFKNNKLFWRTCRECNVEIIVTIYPINLDYTPIEKLSNQYGVPIQILDTRLGHAKFESFLLDPSRKGSRMNYFTCFEMDFLQLKDGKLFSCPQAAYVQRLNNKFLTNFKYDKDDYLPLKNIKRKFDLRLFRWKSKSFCKYCYFPRSKFEWEKTKNEDTEWIKI